jgi:hypothetical protein
LALPLLGAFSALLPDSLYFRNLEPICTICRAEEGEVMDAFLIGVALVGSLAGAFVVQRAMLEGLIRVMNAGRRAR